jgi:hypothetical protein
MRQRERDQAWKHLVSQVDDAKGKMGDVSCAFCAIFNAQENMLSNGLRFESSVKFVCTISVQSMHAIGRT